MRFRHVTCLIGFFVALFLVLTLNIVNAEEPEKIYTLDESIEEALANNWSIKAKKGKIDEAVYVRKQAEAEFLPKFKTSYGYRKDSEARLFRSSAGGDIAISTVDNYEWRATIEQPIFTGFALSSSFELAKLGIDQSEIDFELAKLDLILKVEEAYFDILGADKAVEVTGKEVESLDSNVKVASNFYKVGMIPINDLLQAEVELADAQQNSVRARNISKLARSAFNIVLARPVNAPVEVEDILTYKSETGDFKEYLDSALKNRPEIKILDVNLLQTDQEIRLAKSKYYPEVAMTYDYIKEGDDPDVSGSVFHDAGRWEAMAVLSWTFWEWGKTLNSVKEKESFKRQLIQTRQALLDNISLEIKKAVLDLDEADKNIPTTTKAVEQAEENLRVSEERYKAQVTTMNEVLDAQSLLTQARVNYYRALYGHNLAKARLRRAIGEY
ncbi:MAG: TolC family protein [Deltaproteobacteria bacterium]|nr:TolC family protein [Deltaproteobacteria bacterium]